MNEVIIGALISIGLTLITSLIQKPCLKFGNIYLKTLTYNKDYPALIAKHITIEIINQPLPVGFKWFQRASASMVRAEIDFYDFQGRQLFETSMTARWSGSDQPVMPRLYICGLTGYIEDLTKFRSIDYYDIFSGKNEEIDVAARFDENFECYGWNKDSYFSDPMWRNPHRKIPTGQYFVNITLYHAGEKISKLFILVNGKGENEFCLLPSINDINVVISEHGSF